MRKRSKKAKRRRKSKRSKRKARRSKNLYFKNYDVYVDANPKDTIPIKYTTVDDVKRTIRKLERLYRQKKYDHKRIKQVAMIMMVRLRVIKSKKPRQYSLAKRYHDFLGKRTKASGFNERKKLKFNLTR